MPHLRGAIPSPRHKLAAAAPHVPRAVAPANHLVVPAQLDIWGNDKYGDCCTAEEAFAKGCDPKVFITGPTALAWAVANNFQNGAMLTDVMEKMASAGFPQDGHTYDDGPYLSVNWTDAAILNSAITEGPVKIGVAADQLDNVVTEGRSGWVAVGFNADNNEDHCVSLCGYGALAWLAGQLGGAVPAGVDGAAPGYAMFTWDSVGVIDTPSLLAITHEAWLRQPTSVVN